MPFFFFSLMEMQIAWDGVFIPYNVGGSEKSNQPSPLLCREKLSPPLTEAEASQGGCVLVAELKLETRPLAPILEPAVPQVSLAELPWMGLRPGRRVWWQGGSSAAPALTVMALLCSTDDCPPPPAPFPHRIVELRTGNINSQFSLNSKEALGG